jgi:hypothetical protein
VKQFKAPSAIVRQSSGHQDTPLCEKPAVDSDINMIKGMCEAKSQVEEKRELSLSALERWKEVKWSVVTSQDPGKAGLIDSAPREG